MIDIPFELWAFGIILGFAFTAFGFISKPRIHAMIITSALFLALFTLVTDNLIMGYDVTEEKIFDIQELYHLHDWNADRTIFGTGGNQARAIFVTTTSPLVSDDFFNRLDCIQLPIKKTGSPIGNAQVGILDNNANLEPIQFGQIDVSTLTTTYQWYEFCLPASQHHFIAENDRIGIKYTGGNSTNNISIGVDTTNPIDSTIYMQRFQTSTLTWVDDLTIDISAVLYNRADTTTFEVSPIPYEFGEIPKMLFIAISSMLLIASITLMVKEN